jgi:UDP-2,3-diacylglucosamine hydrolase
MQNPSSLLLIAGSGVYPRLVIDGARLSGVTRIVVLAFDGETDVSLEELADEIHWMRVGQLGRMLDEAKKSGCGHAIMAGQLAPSNLFNLRPDLRALMVLAKLKHRNAETLFGAVAAELAKAGVEVLPATEFMETHLAGTGHLAGPRPQARLVDDLEYGFGIAKEVSRLDIGQTVIVKNGTVLAVEGFEGTNECMRRGGLLGRGSATMVKVSKPNQDLRFDVPVIGLQTLEIADEAGLTAIGVEAGKTLLLDRPAVLQRANELKITIHGLKS